MKTNRHYSFLVYVRVALALLVPSAAVQAQFTFTTNNLAITITRYTGTDVVVTVPSSTNGYPVVSIGANAFTSTLVTTVVLLDGLTSIGRSAFGPCTNLTSVTMPASITNIGDFAFSGCIKLPNITIPPNITTLGSGLFIGCLSFTNVTIPGNITSIQTNAFNDCTNLASVTFPSGVTNIGQAAFADCPKLSYVCFQGNAPVSSGSLVFLSDPVSVIYYVSGTTGWGTSYEGISTAPCAECGQTTPNPYDGFYWTQIGNAISITNYAGAGGDIVIPTNIANLPVTTIGIAAFAGKSSLTSVTVGSNVTNIGLNAFTACSSLTAISVVSNNPAYGSVAGVLFNQSQTTLLQYPGGLTGAYSIPATVTTIGTNSFAGSRVTSVVIPNGVTTIEPTAFSPCANLTSITIPGTVISIGGSAFVNCNSLTNVTLVNGLKDIGTLAFADCASLINITIPGSVTNLEFDAFSESHSLTNVCFEGNAPTLGSFVFSGDPVSVILYVSGGTGWGANYEGIPIEVCAQCGSAGVGALQVTINSSCAIQDGAHWQVDVGAWQNSGAVVTNLSVGNHTVAFTNIIGWITPGNEVVAVTLNTTNLVTGDYVETSIPGVITWINSGGSDQNWSTPANWDLNRAPATSDIVLIPNNGGNPCIMDVNATVAGLIIGDCDGGGSDGLGLNGHTLAVAGSLTIKSNAVFRVDSGILVGTSNTVISGVLGWTSGGLDGTLTLAANCVLNISGNPGGQYFSGCTLTNYGSVTWSDDALSANGSVVIDNYGLWNAQDDRYFYGPNVEFNNYGTFRKSGGAAGYPGTYFYNGAVFNQQAGVLDVQSGTNGLFLTLASGGSFTGGYVTTNNNGLTLLGGNFNINGGVTCSNVLSAGSLIGTNVISGGLTWQNGQWNNTVVTVSSNCVLTIDDASFAKGISGSILTNYGTINWSAAQIDGDGGTVIDNYGVWNAQDDQYFNGGSYGVVFNNFGTFRKSGGVGGYPGTYFNNGAVFNQLAGVLDVQSGTNGLELTLASGGSLTGGYVTTNSNGITLLGNNFNINGTLTCSNVLCGGNLIGTNMINGGLTWQNGQWNNTVVTVSSNTVLTIDNASYAKDISGSILTNYGTINWSAAQISGDGGTIIDNYGVWNAQDDQYFNGGSYGVVFNNFGTFVKSGGVGGYPGTFFTSGAVFNQLAGVLDVRSGTNGLWLTLASGGTFTGGYITTNLNGITDLGGGNININGTLTCTNVLFGGGYLVGTNVIRGGLNWQNGQWNNTVVTLSSNSLLTINNPAFTKGINGSVLTNDGTVNWSAGAVNADGGTVIDNYGLWNAQGSQTFYGSVVFNNFGMFVKSGGVGGYPGTYFYGGTTFNQAGGTLSVQTGDVTLGGAYSLTNGTLNFGINSLTDNGRLQLGALTLGGTLSATVNGSFAPAVGDQFGVIGSSSLSGTFNSFDLPAGIVDSYTNNTVFLTVTGPLPVWLLNPQPVGTNFQFQFPTASNQSYTVQRNDVLSSANWVFYTNITGDGTLYQFQTPVTVTPAQRFFRVRQP